MIEIDQVMKIAIIGGGIGGLTTALALKKVGIPFQLYEQTPAIKAVGAGIILANNAMQVYKHLGVHKAIEQAGNKITCMQITNAHLEPLSDLDLQPFEAHYQLQNQAILRSDLHAILVQHVGEENIVLNKRLQNIQKNDEGYQLLFEDGSCATTPFVIGADGIHSKVRQTLFPPSTLRDSHQWCWRGVVNYQLDHPQTAIEAWGQGARCGIVAVNNTQVYWYFTLNDNLGVLQDSPKKHLHRFDKTMEDIILATPQENIIASKLMDLKPINTWNTENVCLIGDAAHATTPNLGQGACQAIEDAYVLGELLKKYDVAKAFQLYPVIRRKKAHFVVNTSWKFGKLAQLNNPFGIFLRNCAVKYLIPKNANKKQLGYLFELDKIE